MIAYKTHMQSGVSVPGIPDDFPFVCVNFTGDSSYYLDNGYVVVEDEEFNQIQSSLDLSAYTSAQNEIRQLDQQKAQRIYGELLAKDLVDLMGQKNLAIAESGGSVNTTSLLQSFGSVETLVRLGSLKTARSLCTQLVAGFPSYADLFNFAISEITYFLTTNGYE